MSIFIGAVVLTVLTLSYPVYAAETPSINAQVQESSNTNVLDGSQSDSLDAELKLDSVDVEESRQKNCYVRIHLGIFDTSLGVFGGSLEVPFFRSKGKSYGELLFATGLGTTEPLNGYWTAMFKWTYGTKHRLELGTGVSILLKQAKIVEQPQYLSLSDSPVNPNLVIAYRWESNTGFIFRAILSTVYDVNGVDRQVVNFPGFSIGVAI